MKRIQPPRNDEVAKLLEKAIDRPDIERIIHWVEKRGYKIKESELPSWYINGLFNEKEEHALVGVNVLVLLAHTPGVAVPARIPDTTTDPSTDLSTDAG